MRPLLPTTLEKLVSGIRDGGDGIRIVGKIGGVGQSGAGAGIGGSVRVWVRYEAHMSVLYLRERGNSCTILVGVVLFMFQGRVL